MKWQKRSPLKNIVKKNHPWVAARLASRHVARAAWANDGSDLLPQPTPAGGLADDAVRRRLDRWALPPAPMPAGGALPPGAMAASWHGQPTARADSNVH
jgi:hypothetical protein